MNLTLRARGLGWFRAQATCNDEQRLLYKIAVH